jgi:RNase P/RNase MRP subunit POP5
MVLRRKDKHRYLLLYVNDEIFNEIDTHFQDTDNKDIRKSITILRKRFSDLFGTIELEKASINIVFENNLCPPNFPNFLIIKCKLASMDNILCAIALSYPPLTTIKISGTIKKLTSSIAIEKHVEYL